MENAQVLMYSFFSFKIISPLFYSPAFFFLIFYYNVISLFEIFLNEQFQSLSLCNVYFILTLKNKQLASAAQSESFAELLEKAVFMLPYF